uniref:Ptype ATPase (PATPase) Superfamily putative n=1 Tax=Albugo laibachii Nc14 TaxID=890382 RepID=F0W4B8_9STRA|nr:Ptype ATPase (PATPase) Superfamily putative [Albugo laibachii Nc14]|eukprot:CCA15951.1 Ptype ATPase (PATPase) Superfamily putative [Albugo laibachii Nc14]
MSRAHISWTGQSIQKLSLYRPRQNPIPFLSLKHIPFVILYAYAISQSYHTIGEPYALALEEYQSTHPTPTTATDLASQTLSEGIVREDTITTAASSNAIWEDEVPLPNPYLPAIGPLLFLIGTILLHALTVLLQVWFVRVRAWIRFTSVNALKQATFVAIKPRAYRGKSDIVPLQSQLINGEKSYFFMFQKHKYIARIGVSSDKKTDKSGVSICFEKLKAPTSLSIRTYVSSRGLQTKKSELVNHVDPLLQLYGPNVFEIPRPNFVDMFKQQLLEPLTVFQIFSVCLYMLDEYWQYSLFTLAMIVMFEGVTVMGRLKNLQTLCGMSNEARDVFVYRDEKWITIKSDGLVPGDIVSITRDTKEQQNSKSRANVVPCDCLLLDGSAVMNEATLTGESVPQMKEAIRNKINPEELAQDLDMKALHKVHVLFGGTTVMQSDSRNTSEEADKRTGTSTPCPPDGGCTAYVLRTGFSSSQGKLLRMIEFSSGKVSGSSMDAIGLALLLLVFALISSGYVLNQGIAQKGKITFELLLRCVLIITSVIPAELPMQTAMAVNSALLSLVKLSIFCTEPFRISLAGKVDICLFDKTGTLTTDQLTAIGVVCDDDDATRSKGASNIKGHVPMASASLDTSLVLAGCHSLVQIDGKLIGDPVEEASIRAVDFEYDTQNRRYCPNPGKERHWDGKVECHGKDVAIDILHRNHFASKLQRMSVLARVHLGSKTCIRSLVKGSPETIFELLSPDTAPDWYWPTYQSMAKRGMRVLALAYKNIDSLSKQQLAEKPRSWAESDLRFAGFAAFQCLVRRDSADIIKSLKESSHSVSMITGDATLTAVHVSREVGIISRAALLLEVKDSSSVIWTLLESETSSQQHFQVDAYRPGDFGKLTRKYDLCLSGKALSIAAKIDLDTVWKQLHHVRVFARMTPELKENVLTSLKKSGHYTLMCGDGGNDVGALKQAHIGVALLSGFGSANADKSITGASKYKKEAISSIGSRQGLMKLHTSALKKLLVQKKIDHSKCREKEDLVTLLLEDASKLTTQKQIVQVKKAPTAEEKKEIMKKKQAEIEADVRARETQGESFARVRALAAFAKREAAEAKRLKQERTGAKGFAAFANNAAMQQYMDDFDDGELPMVKLGDASIASPFTSRAPSIKGCVDIIRQGRCALVTTTQMYQILAINCLISSYSLSVLYLDKVKYSNAQMVTLGIVSTVASVTLSRATPLPTLSPVRPLTSIFCPALFLSLAGQFVLHLGCMIYLTNLAKTYLDADETTSASTNALGIAEFKPNVMGTVIFLVNSVQTVSVCAVNYKGRPFMKSMTDNPGLLYSLGISIVGVFLLCTEALPIFNEVLQIVPMPDPRFARLLTFILALDVFGAFVWDQICLFLFAPKIFIASIKSITLRDLWQSLKMTLIALVVIYVLSNIDYEEIERQHQLMEQQKLEGTN